MINFDFSDEQKSIKEAVADFARKEIKPILRKMENQKQIPSDVVKGLAEMGLLGMTVSKEYGGIEADPITVGVVAEELAKADISCAIPTFFLVEAVWGYILNKYGTDKIKREVLPKVTKGEAFLGIASTEPDAGSDIGNTRTNAKRSGNNYIINGEKMFISGVSEITNQLPGGGGYITVTKTDPSKGTRGVTLLYVPAKGTKGISPTYLEDWGRKGISTGGLSFEDVSVPKENIIGKENEGFYRLMEGFDFARGIISVICAGAAMSALEHGMEYLKMRKAFDNPIGKYEGLQFKLAEHWTKMEGIRLLGYRALWMKNKENNGENIKRLDVTNYCAQAKLLAPQFAFEAINEAIQWFGAFGYTEECPLELALKGVRSYFWAEGTLEIMRLIVARELLGKEYIAK